MRTHLYVIIWLGDVNVVNPNQSRTPNHIDWIRVDHVLNS